LRSCSQNESSEPKRWLLATGFLQHFKGRHLIDAAPILDIYGVLILDAWDALAAFIATVRVKRKSQGYWENFEYLAALSAEDLRKHPEGLYPRGARRMTLPASWSEAFQQTAPTDVPVDHSSA
jgi:hypothetical protein